MVSCKSSHNGIRKERTGMTFFKQFTGACVLLILAATSVQADVQLPAIIAENMVLQRDQVLPIWGKADPGEQVTVKQGDQTTTTTTNADGRSLVKLPAMKAGGPHTLTISGKNTITLKNILIGEVWVCSGQSNMEWAMKNVNNAKQEMVAADHPQIRLFHVQHKRSSTELDDLTGGWNECTPKSVPDFSAVAYFFGRYLHKHLDVPVGVIETAWGGTPAEKWTPPSMFKAVPSLLKTADHPYAREAMSERSVLYNGMVAPLIPFAIRGAIWYQGESNVSMGRHYRKLFSGMITGWRNEWKQGDFPFLYVQIAPWNYSQVKEWPQNGCLLVREAQLKTLALKNTAMAVTMDIGNVKDIHPRNKQDVGKRLGLAARAIAYGEKLVYSGPIYKSMKSDGRRIVLHFDHVGGGLVAKGGPLTTFQIAGEDRKFVEAIARIEGNSVVIYSAQVAKPAAVRFAWSDAALPNLFNTENLPASPFRTDSWPVLMMVAE